jgi:hypothetical protein
MAAGAVPPRMAWAWQRTAYRAGGAVARIGRRSAGLDALLRAMGVRRGAFVGAANPLGRRMPDGWNRRMHARLGERLRRLARREGEGVGRGWSEPHWLIGGDPRPALRLARVFRQRGVVIVEQGRPARLWVNRTYDIW